jgi:hypothetical protein
VMASSLFSAQSGFVLTASGVLSIERGSGGTPVTASGPSTLAGSLIVTVPAGCTGVPLTLFSTSSGSISGTFASTSLPTGATLVYSASSVDLQCPANASGGEGDATGGAGN